MSIPTWWQHSTPIAVVTAHDVINVRSLASHLQDIRKSVADEVAQVAKLVASMSIPFASMSISVTAIPVIVAMIAIRYF